MTGRSRFNIISIFLTTLLLNGLVSSLYSQDVKISGIVNSYKSVISIGTSPRDNVTLNDVTGLVAGDYVLLIQMKGASINVPEAGQYGSYKDLYGAPGLSEFLVIKTINTGTKNVVFNTAEISNNFDVEGIVQLIKIPYYNSATVDNTLTCQAWDPASGTGGVLAMIIGNTLRLDANIDVTGKGFRGAQPVTSIFAFKVSVSAIIITNTPPLSPSQGSQVNKEATVALV